tara:strand:+ start:69 stop:821 length:753 start_codon:yes stop_codon:yes gene_type:complete
MFLFWNYTIEAFFWILLGAIALISLTIFFASPRSKPRVVDLETHDGEITETEQYAKKESNSDYDVLEPKNEDAEFEAFVESLPAPLQAIVSIRLVIGMIYGALIIAFGFIDLEISNENYGSVPNLMIFFTSIFAGVTFSYGVYLDSRIATKSAARLIAIYCLFLFPLSSGFGYLEAGILACIALTYSNDLIWVWRLFAHGDTARGSNVRYYEWFFELMNGERPVVARLLLYLLLFFFFWMSFSMLASIAG